LLDELSFHTGDSIDALNNVVFTLGVETRFGLGSRRSYWPWNPSRAFY